MGKSRRKHTDEFKLEAVKQVVEGGRSVSEVADNLGINRNMLSRWRAELSLDGAMGNPESDEIRELRDEIKELKRDLRIAEQEREILKKATAYFAKNKD